MNDCTLLGFVKSGHVPEVLHEYVGLEKTRPETFAATVVDPPVVIGFVEMLIGTVWLPAELTVRSVEVPKPLLPYGSDTETVNMQLAVIPVVAAL